jgi:hypothetical protein
MHSVTSLWWINRLRYTHTGDHDRSQTANFEMRTRTWDAVSASNYRLLTVTLQMKMTDQRMHRMAHSECDETLAGLRRKTAKDGRTNDGARFRGFLQKMWAC